MTDENAASNELCSTVVNLVLSNREMDGFVEITFCHQSGFLKGFETGNRIRFHLTGMNSILLFTNSFEARLFEMLYC